MTGHRVAVAFYTRSVLWAVPENLLGAPREP